MGVIDEVAGWCTCSDYRETGTHGVDIDGVECEVLQVGRLIAQARQRALDEAAQHMDNRADVIASADNITAHTMARVYRDEAQAIRALKDK